MSTSGWAGNEHPGKYIVGAGGDAPAQYVSPLEGRKLAVDFDVVKVDVPVPVRVDVPVPLETPPITAKCMVGASCAPGECDTVCACCIAKEDCWLPDRVMPRRLCTNADADCTDPCKLPRP